MLGSLVKFYAGKTVLVTGGTGFMGRVLVEKLLRSCPDIGRIYLVVRPKKGLTTQQRMQEYFCDEVFYLVNKNKALLSKVQGLKGDITEDELGLSLTDLEKVYADTNIVFHMAANIELNPSLHDEVTDVLIGTQNVMNVSKNIKNLQALVYASTAYVGVLKKKVEERVYDPPISHQKILELHAAGELNHQRDNLLGEWPITYVFTKAVTEALVVDTHAQIHAPLAIFRPAFVSHTWKEPLPGWINNLNGSAGLTYALGTGLCRVVRMNPKVPCQFVPCDFTINCFLACAWDIATNRPDHVKVYNYTADSNPISLQIALEKVVSHPGLASCTLLPFPGWITTNASTEDYQKYQYFANTVPAHILDEMANTFGRKKKYAKLAASVNNFMSLISDAFIIPTTYEFKNVKALWEKMSTEDQSQFPFNMESVNWDEYLGVFCPGLQKYVLKHKSKL